eukprot:4160036-Heterocapsa_arctica.AAC.1
MVAPNGSGDKRNPDTNAKGGWRQKVWEYTHSNYQTGRNLENPHVLGMRNEGWLSEGGKPRNVLDFPPREE